jgi:CRISPR-associated endoribonuclease Cas6
VGLAKGDELNQEGYNQYPFEDFDQHATQDTLVSHSDRLQIVDFQVIAVRISACAPRDFRLCGNLLRGGFGKALRRVDAGAYARWFEPRVNEGPSGLKDSPRGFVVRVVDRGVAAGERFEFGVNLFDPLAGGGAIVRAVFEQMFRVERVEQEHLRLPLEGGRAASRVRVSFVTPTELKGAERPEFGILFARLRDRISTLRALYQGGALDIDFKAMAERAAAVKMTRCEIEKIEAERVSRNTGQRHSLGGFVGLAEYEGEIAEFLPYLEIGRYTGVGRQTVWGKGEIHAVVE